MEIVRFVLERYDPIEEFDLKFDAETNTASVLVRLKEDYVTQAYGAKKYCAPGGLEIYYISTGEPEYFYKDIFVEDNYVSGFIKLQEGDVIFDVGANVGYFSLYVNSVLKKYQVFAFEPAPPVYDVLTLNILKHGLSVIPVNAGLSNEQGTLSFTYYPNSSGYSTFSENVEEEKALLKQTILNQLNSSADYKPLIDEADSIVDSRFEKRVFECETTTVSEIIRRHEVTSIGLMKIDAEKYEYNVLLGIETADFARIRQIVVEIHDQNSRVDDIVNLLEENNFETQVYQNKGYTNTVMYSVFAKNRQPRVAEPFRSSPTSYTIDLFSASPLIDQLKTNLRSTMLGVQFDIRILPF